MKRALLLAAPAALVLGLVACSGDDDDSPESTSPDTEETTTDETTEDTEDTGDVTIPDITIPDITIPDITFPGGSLPDITIPDFTLPSLPGDATEMIESMVGQMFPNLDEEQVQCLSEAFTGQLDMSEIQAIAEECNIDPSDLQPGG